MSEKVLHTRFIRGLSWIQVEIPRALSAYSKRASCWIDFDAQGFFAGIGRKTLVSAYWSSDFSFYFEAPDSEVQRRALGHLQKALGFSNEDFKWDRNSDNHGRVEKSPTLYFKYAEAKDAS